MTIEVRTGSTRFRTSVGGMTTYHSFSYGAHYDPANTAFGALIALNDEQLPPGTGYDDHRHAGATIVTWVLDGSLHHSDSLGNDLVLRAGSIAVAHTGSGITHAERTVDGVRFLQFMLRADDPATSYSRVGPGPGLREHRAGPDATLLAGDVPPGRLTLPDASRLHVFVVSGRATIGDRALGPDDAARLTGQGGRALVVEEPATLAVWALG